MSKYVQSQKEEKVKMFVKIIKLYGNIDVQYNITSQSHHYAVTINGIFFNVYTSLLYSHYIMYDILIYLQNLI